MGPEQNSPNDNAPRGERGASILLQVDITE